MSHVNRSMMVAGVAALTLGVPSSGSAATTDRARELGSVHWQRDFDAGIDTARSDGRPLFLLFQEVPGCSTCVGFGEHVLSHPLLVEAIETEFVPVAVFNNGDASDRAVLRRFDEPSWNNPVVRFVDAEGRDLIPRRDGVWTPHGIASRMVASLRAADRPVPEYLSLAEAETRARFPQHATFETHCFWQGEVCVGDLDGVVSTEAAWLEGREVVDVAFDPNVTSYAALLQSAEARGCASAVWTKNEAQASEAATVYGDRVQRSDEEPRRASDSDQKRHLRRTALHRLDLTPLQETRVNAALANGTDALRWLSPRQAARHAANGPTEPGKTP